MDHLSSVSFDGGRQALGTAAIKNAEQTAHTSEFGRKVDPLGGYHNHDNYIYI